LADPSPAAAPPQRLTLTTWLILAMAAIGFAFDIYELLMLPLVLPPALSELLPHAPPGSPEFNLWRGLMFWVPALAGGAFGLVGGYLTDLLGRRRVLTWSILLYALSAFAAGFSTSMPMLLVLRTTTFVGVCVEFVAAVAWLAELFPNHEQRERALGYTQAFSSIGGLMVGGAFLLAQQLAPSLPPIILPEFLASSLGEVGGPHAPWRYTLMSGLIPALPLIVIRPFLPESPIWQQKKEAGTLKRPSFAELFTPRYLRTTLITTVMVACSYGAAFGAIQQIPQIVPGLPEVRPEVAAALEAGRSKIAAAAEEARRQALTKVDDPVAAKEQIDEEVRKAEARVRRQIAQPIQGRHAGQLALAQEVGGLVGRFVLAALVVYIVSRRALLRVFQVPGLFVLPIVFTVFTVENRVLFTVGTWDVSLLHVGIFFVGLLTVAQFSFWGNYLPTVYPVHLRGTGESVAANIGGRMIGTSFAALTSLLSPVMPGPDDPTRVAYTAAVVGTGVYVLGLIASFWLPEPKEETLRE
jgi:MFS family permease